MLQATGANAVPLARLDPSRGYPASESAPIPSPRAVATIDQTKQRRRSSSKDAVVRGNDVALDSWTRVDPAKGGGVAAGLTKEARKGGGASQWRAFQRKWKAENGHRYVGVQVGRMFEEINPFSPFSTHCALRRQEWWP